MGCAISLAGENEMDFFKSKLISLGKQLFSPRIARNNSFLRNLENRIGISPGECIRQKPQTCGSLTAAPQSSKKRNASEMASTACSSSSKNVLQRTQSGTADPHLAFRGAASIIFVLMRAC